jgi:hypothetical protein
MLTFTVHEPPHPPADRLQRAESLVFVKDGFSWPAALFSPVWLLVSRLWWPFAAYVVLAGLLELIRWRTNVPSEWVTLAGFALHAVIGFEAGTLRRWSLDRRGWRTLGSVTGRRLAECERRFYEEWLPGQLAAAPPPPSPRIPAGGLQAGRTPVLGSLIGIRS